MKKLLGQIAFVLSLLCFGNAFAQQVMYSLQDGNGQPLGQMNINYKPNGYEATMNGEKISLETTHNTATVTMGKLVITMPINNTFYHKEVDKWVVRPVTTSFGDKGVHKMLYFGLAIYGRHYREELWLNGRLFMSSSTVIDHNDQIIWSFVKDSHGALSLRRL